MPSCSNCGSFVTEDYVRVLSPDGAGQPRACPFCEDMVRENGRVRAARSPRNTARK